ncbi:MAG: c-type cytochrome [candidate division Zixibacteria bacterium]|nr:c-type cytochrome [candidate division Zixibacteria bacterium]
MDFPLFFMDEIGNRLLMAVIAIVHVLINHPLAVGAYPLVTLLEWWGRRNNDAAIDNLAYRVAFVLFVVTTTVGALTGVGIWFSAGLIAPFGIGSLLRVFFWAWFIEWLVFISEVVLIMVYVLTWKRWADGLMKKVHIGVGVLLSALSWATMVIIVAVLGFMMGSGTWTQNQSFLSAVFNPLYLPQLAFRTAFAMVAAGLVVWFLMFFFTKQAPELRRRAVRFVSIWILGWTPLWLGASLWYWNAVPAAMQANVNVGLLTQAFQNWHSDFVVILGVVVAIILVTAVVGALNPRLIPRAVLLVPCVLGLFLLGHFERVREFIRKPHVVADYMYSNGVTMTELPVFQRDGLLTYATYVRHKSVTSANKIEAGEDISMLACSRCHTTTGVNALVDRFEKLYGTEPWDEAALGAFVSSMHMSRTYMPPFPGNTAEAEALVAYLRDLQQKRGSAPGAQTLGIPRAAAVDNNANVNQ